MRLPRDIYGEDLIRHLVKHWDYNIDSQRGSHVVLTSPDHCDSSPPSPANS